MNLKMALCLPRDGKTVAVVRAVAMDALAQFGVTTECIDDVGLALSEACANVIRHAEESDEYEVRLEIDNVRCAITVIDAGRGLDVGTLTATMPEPSSPGGRGMALMKALTDQVVFTSKPESGTIVHLVKRLTLSPVAPLSHVADG